MDRVKPYVPFGLVAIILVGYFLRIYHLGVVPLRGDEAFSIQYWAGIPLSKSLSTIAAIEPHPFLAYVAFRAWGLLVGDSEFGMRYLPAIANTIGIASLYALGKRLGGWRLGLVAALLFMLHPYEIWHAQDARNYAIWAGVSTATVWLGIIALDSKKRQAWVLYTVIAAIAANIFYSELFTLAAFGVFVVVTRWREKRIIWGWIFVASIVVITSGTSFFILQRGLFGGEGYAGNISTQPSLSQLVTVILPTLNFGATLPISTLTIAGLAVALLSLIVLFVIWQRNRKEAVLLGSLTIVPAFLLSLVSLRVHIFDSRYILASVPAYILLVAVAIRYVSKYGRSMSIVLLGTWILFCSYSLFNYYFSQTYAKSKDWPSVVQFLHRNISQGELVIQSTVDPAFGYYFHKISSQISDIALPANPTQSQQNIVKELEVVTSTAVGIWRVGHPNPEWINSNVVEAWLDSNMQLTFDGHIADIAIRQYKSWDIPASEIDSAEIARFGDIAELVDFKIFMNSHEDVTIWLYWRPLKTTTSPLKVFVHMLGSVNPATGSPIWTQDDQYPQGGHTGSDIWKIGSLYRDIYRLSLNDVPEGTYSVEIGFYDPTTNVRLPVGARDSLLLTEIMVK